MFLIKAVPLKKESFDIYRAVSTLRDFGLCLKIYLLFDLIRFDNKNHIFSLELLAFSTSDFMYVNFFIDISIKEVILKNFNILNINIFNKELSDKETIKINNLLSKKNLLIIGKNNLTEKIKIIEKDIKFESI